MSQKKSGTRGSRDISLDDYVEQFERIRTVFDSLPDGIVAILNKDMNIAAANKAISEMLHEPLPGIVGRRLSDLFKDKIPELEQIIRDAFESRQEVRNYTIEVVTPSSDVCSYLLSTAIINELDESDFGIVVILHDVSELSRLRKIALQTNRYGEVIGKSEAMQNIYALIESIKHFDSSVLIIGETGTGKELIARAIHNSSDRKREPFVPVNCSALPENLIESELFGHVKGAFTGAISSNIGRFRSADGGTLFLDEVGTLPEQTQIKLLRALQDKVVEPLGSSERVLVNIRIISASNRDLGEMVNNSGFRKDLFYRLKVMQIDLPPLRERGNDITLLVDHFITRLNRYYRKNIVGISQGAKELILNYPWPGNVRELENAIEHAYVLTRGAIIESSHLPPDIRYTTCNGTPPPPPEVNLNAEEEEIRRALLASKGNHNEAAKILSVHRTTLWRKMKEFRISKDFGKKAKS
jgi:transcriptional regulator with PAS, ATPase and Fis domain